MEYNKQILFYVDDDRDDLDLFKEAASVLGMTVYLFTLGSDMIDALLNPPPTPDFIFVDLNMPRISGYEVIAQIRNNKLFDRTPIIVLSTANDLKSMNTSRVAGASYYIQKPTSIAALRDAIHYVSTLDWTQPSENFVYDGNAINSRK